MTRPVRYCRAFNDIMREPINDEPSIAEDEAREQYETLLENPGRTVIVVDASRPGEGDVVYDRFRIGFSVAGVRLAWKDRYGSIVRASDYRWVCEREGDWTRGRLFRETMIDYAYPTGDRKYGQHESDIMRSHRFFPDGRAMIMVVKGGVPGADVGEASGGDMSRLWRDRPVFGDWESLLDPWFGLDEDPDLPRSLFLDPA